MKLVCLFSGWFEIDTKNVELANQDGETKTAKDWLKEKGGIENLILCSFGDALKNSDIRAFTDIDLSIEDEDGNKLFTQ